MDINYDELLKKHIDVYKAIEAAYNQKYEKMSLEEIIDFTQNSPALVPNNPLLADYDYVSANIEKIFILYSNQYNWHQGFEQYYTFFKALTKKFSIEEDYNKVLYGLADSSIFLFKWENFTYKLINFFDTVNQDIWQQLLNQEDFVNYFLNHQLLYQISTLEHFSHKNFESFLNYEQVAAYYIEDYHRIINLIRCNPFIQLPQSIMTNRNIIKQIAHNPNTEEFFHNLMFIASQTNPDPYIEEYQKYCDSQINNAINGILPCLKQEYETSPQSHFYQEQSKQKIIEMFISRYYETEPYNLLIDIETLYKFAKENNRTLKGYEIYKFLVNYENKSSFELIEFYKKIKNLPLMDMLYDDWQSQHKSFVQEMNQRLFSLQNQKVKTKNNISYYDITDCKEPILVHNTLVPNNNLDKIDKLITKVKTGQTSFISLSLQNQLHQTFYENRNDTINFAYGPLDPGKVGIVYHEDAYSQGPRRVEIANKNYIRRLYTVDSLLEETESYNEIVYVISGSPLLPIGIICENTITEGDIIISETLNIPILFRNVNKQAKETSHSSSPPYKQYHRF